MLSEPFDLIKNYRQQKDGLKLTQKKKLIPIKKKLVKKIHESKRLSFGEERNSQKSLIQSKYLIEPSILMEQYSDVQIQQDQYSPLLFNEFKFTFHDSYCENLNLSDEAIEF